MHVVRRDPYSITHVFLRQWVNLARIIGITTSQYLGGQMPIVCKESNILFHTLRPESVKLLKVMMIFWWRQCVVLVQFLSQLHWATDPYKLHQESICTSLKVAANVQYQRILLDSWYTPAGLLIESIRMETIPGLLIPSCQNPSRTPPKPI